MTSDSKRPANLLSDIAAASDDEQLTILLARPGIRIERIVSFGHVTPEDAPYDQAWDEWVLLVSGAARLWVDGAGELGLSPGDHLLIPAHRRHRVSWTAPDEPTVWLAIHLASDDGA